MIATTGFLMACATAQPGKAGAGTGDTAADTAEDSGSDTNIDSAELNGTVPPEALAAPEFSATNRDGGKRSRPDLIGHPSVIWFYPAATTGG